MRTIVSTYSGSIPLTRTPRWLRTAVGLTCVCLKQQFGCVHSGVWLCIISNLIGTKRSRLASNKLSTISLVEGWPYLQAQVFPCSPWWAHFILCRSILRYVFSGSANIRLVCVYTNCRLKPYLRDLHILPFHTIQMLPRVMRCKRHKRTWAIAFWDTIQIINNILVALGTSRGGCLCSRFTLPVRQK